MRIVYVITRAEIGGAQTHVADLLKGFARHHELHLIAGESGYLTEFASALSIPCHVLPNLVQPMSPAKDARALVDIARVLRDIQPDLVHAHTSKAGILARLASFVVQIPCVFTAHTWCFSEGTSLAWKLVGIPAERLAARISAKIITVSDANRNLAISHRISPHRLQTVHNGIEDAKLMATPGESQLVRVVMVARFAHQKDHESMLRAFADVSEPAELLLVGDGPLRPAIEQLAVTLGIRRRVKFLGNRLDVPEILSFSHVFALATRFEGLPISILEAMRAGLPVLTHDAGGTGESVVDGVNGFVVPVGDLNSFKIRLRQLVCDAGLRARMGAQGRRDYREKFTVEAMLVKTMDVYSSALRARPNYRRSEGGVIPAAMTK